MHEDPADAWIDDRMEPKPSTKDARIMVGIPFQDKLLVVRWLMQKYDLSIDQAMQDTDALERFMEINR